MSYNLDNRPAQTLNEPTTTQHPTEELQILQETRLCDAPLTVYGTPAEPLFLAKEVAEAIDHQQVARMMELVADDEKLMCSVSTSGQRREMWFLTEYGLYEVLMQSRKPVARRFKAGVKELLRRLRTGEPPMSGMEMRRTARLIESIADRMQTLRSRYSDLEEASRQIPALQAPQAALPAAEPLCGVDPIILRGRAWYPLRDLLRALTGAKQPNTAGYASRYPDRTMTYHQAVYCDAPLARYIAARKELSRRQQALTASLFDNL